jgi:hypothetical protein
VQESANAATRKQLCLHGRQAGWKASLLLLSRQLEQQQVQGSYLSARAGNLLLELSGRQEKI